MWPVGRDDDLVSPLAPQRRSSRQSGARRLREQRNRGIAGVADSLVPGSRSADRAHPIRRRGTDRGIDESADRRVHQRGQRAGLSVGPLIGILAGVMVGWMWGTLLVRLMDFLLSFSPLVLAIIAVAFAGSSIPVLVLVIAAMYVPQLARVAYNSTRSVKERDFVVAAEATGASLPRIELRAVLRSIPAPLVVQFSLSVGHATLVEAGLSFVGLGPAPPTVSWGQMIRQAVGYLSLGYYPVIWPSLFISFTILGLNVLGDSLRDSLDPSLN